MDGAIEGMVEDVRIIRMKTMGPKGDRGYVVQVKQEGRWVKVLEDATDGEVPGARQRRGE